MKSRLIALLTATYIALLVGLIGLGFYQQNEQQKVMISGQVVADEIRISAKIPGRVHHIAVKAGSLLQAGDLVFSLDSPEIDAKMEQAQAALDAKTAMSARAERGARGEEIQMVKEAWQRAETAAELADTTLARLKSLHSEGLIAQQQLDEAVAKQRSARLMAESAQQRYQLIQSGTEEELKRAAEGEKMIAEAMLAEVEAARAETEIRSPRQGEVTDVLIHEGEIAPAGFPVVTLVDMSTAYARFHVPEGQLSHYLPGSQIQAYVPALGVYQSLTVDYVAPMADYANWNASHRGEYDLKTFEVHASPKTALAGWRLGMTLVIEERSK